MEGGGFLGRGRISANAPHIIPPALLIPWNNKWKAVITPRSYFPNDPTVRWKYGLCWLTQTLRQGGFSALQCNSVRQLDFHHLNTKLLSFYPRYVYVWGVGWRGLKSIANIIPLSMSLAPCLFNHPRQICLKYSNLPKTVSHQTAKWPYFSCYSSIMILTFSNKKWELRDYP